MTNPKQLTEAEAKKIGSRKGLLAVSVGLVLVQLIITALLSADMGVIKAFLWFTQLDYNLNIFIGVVILLSCGYFFGGVAGKQVLLQKGNFVLIGFLWGMAVLLTAAFLAGWIGFFQEGLDNIGSKDNPFEDYIFKPFYWVSLSGCIPASLIGIWFGSQLKRTGRKRST